MEYLLNMTESNSWFLRGAIPESIKFFDIEDLPLQSSEFMTVLQINQNKLEWDFYDVERSIVNYLKNTKPHIYRDRYQEYKKLTGDVKEKIKFWDDYVIIPEYVKRPFRKRCIGNYRLTKQKKNEWKVIDSSTNSFVQDVEDARSEVRVFKLLPLEIRSNLEILKFICHFAQVIQFKNPSANNINATLHYVTTYAYQGKEGSPAPEGIHQDGADYIVSAMVISRKNVKGGISKIYSVDAKTVILEKLLKERQGIFQADSSYNYYHEITPISLDNLNLSEGYRSILGVDFKINN